MAKESTTKDLRRRNRTRVLRALVSEGESTRAELSASLELSLATVANVVNDLILEGFAYGPSLIPSHGGRPTGTLNARPEGAYFVGADVGEATKNDDNEAAAAAVEEAAAAAEEDADDEAKDEDEEEAG